MKKTVGALENKLSIKIADYRNMRYANSKVRQAINTVYKDRMIENRKENVVKTHKRKNYDGDNDWEKDGKIHFTPANLTNKFHRSLEPVTTGRILKAMFSDDKHFAHHQHLPDNDHFGDEGAANHNRLGGDYAKRGVQVFVYGQQHLNNGLPGPKRYPARQTREASEAIARLHRLDAQRTVFIQQNPDVIDQGVFHNDVIAVGNRNVLFYHQQAFLNTQLGLQEIQRKFGDAEPLHFIEVADKQVSVADAISSYLFNTQLINLPNDEMVIIAPTECQEHQSVYRYLTELCQQDTPIKAVKYIDVKQSMQNGGGPACLRLRVVLTEQEHAAVNPAVLMNDQLFATLNNWVDKHYRDRLTEADLADPQLLQESRTALDELTQILQLGSVYSFQR